MVPREEVENAQPSTLPADFSEWDSGEASKARPASFNGFDAAPVAPKPPKVQATAQASVLPAAGHLPHTASRAQVYAEAEPVFQPSQFQGAHASGRRQAVESQGRSKGKTMPVVFGSLALLLALGAVGYFKMRPNAVAPKQPAVQQTAASASAANTPASAANTSAAAKPSTPAADNTPAPADTEPDRPVRASSGTIASQLNAPSRIPSDLRMLAGKEPPPSSGFGAPGAEGLGGGSSVFNGQSGPNVKVANQKVSISAGVAGGLLIQKTPPVYPQLARAARVSGIVVIQATISKTGVVENVHAVSGPSMLRQPALDAVKTWRYRPYMLDGEPVEVETTVSVNFTIGG